MEAADIVVKVDVQKFSSLDFDKAQALILKGTQAAEEKAKILLPYALDQAAWNAYLAKRDARRKRVVGVVQFVRVNGTSADCSTRSRNFSSLWWANQSTRPSSTAI